MRGWHILPYNRNNDENKKFGDESVHEGVGEELNIPVSALFAITRDCPEAFLFLLGFFLS